MRSNGLALTLIVTACVGGGSYEAAGTMAQSTPCLVTTVGGDVQGVNNGASCAFLGVPFAAPPVAERRWKPPLAAPPWAPVVLNATTPPPSCPTINTGAPSGSEDCLKLNIWVRNPMPAQPAPVIVWLHTGGFSAASANFPSHNGRRLAEETGAIVVAPNYRHGPFGFLAHPAFAGEDATHASTGNYGLLDQRAALAWVRDNITYFGGNPANVTLAGTSAGGQSVGLQLVSPGSEQLFHRAMVHSAFPTLRMPTAADVALQAHNFATALGCTGEAVRACLRSKTRDEVLRALPIAMEQVTEPLGRVHWRPVVDGVVIPDQPRVLLERGSFHRVPLVVGATRDEGWGNVITRSFPTGVDGAQYESWVNAEFGAFAPDVAAAYPVGAFGSAVEAMARVVGDGQFTCEARRLARLFAGHKVPAFLFSYEYEIDDLAVDHVIHGVESNIIFGNNYVPPQFTSHVLDESDLALHAVMSGYWVAFAKSGDPNPRRGHAIKWPAVKRGAARSIKYLVFDTAVRKARARADQCELWDGQFLRALTLDVPASQP